MGDLDGGAVGIGAGWPDRNVAQHSQTVSSSSLMEPWTGSILHTNKNTTVILLMAKKLREETCGQPIMGGGYYVP